ncbi:hypothetical protein C0Q70_03311 [Pomacea canaliculata]|uniref:Uncharacterized protein n=1 Tax=Pomacea canaliculata TaxID=400727 RepID=A0A2T7PSC6_POMCA|nr:hypothetical protein C0Q70_03311 [Pomacea canaliculata]
MAKYRRRRNTLLASGSNLSDVPLIEIWFAIIGAIWWLGAALWKLWQLNPFSLIIERQRRLYYHDNRGALTIRPPWTERLADMFRSAQCHFDFGMADLGNMTLELCGGAAREMKSIEKTHRGEKNRGVLFRTRASAFD